MGINEVALLGVKKKSCFGCSYYQQKAGGGGGGGVPSGVLTEYLPLYLLLQAIWIRFSPPKPFKGGPLLTLPLLARSLSVPLGNGAV